MPITHRSTGDVSLLCAWRADCHSPVTPTPRFPRQYCRWRGALPVRITLWINQFHHQQFVCASPSWRTVQTICPVTTASSYPPPWRISGKSSPYPPQKVNEKGESVTPESTSHRVITGCAIAFQADREDFFQVAVRTRVTCTDTSSPIRCAAAAPASVRLYRLQHHHEPWQYTGRRQSLNTNQLDARSFNHRVRSLNRATRPRVSIIPNASIVLSSLQGPERDRSFNQCL